MRMDHKNENHNMLDLIAYRIQFMAHPKAGSRWCIYIFYDYTHFTGGQPGGQTGGHHALAVHAGV